MMAIKNTITTLIVSLVYSTWTGQLASISHPLVYACYHIQVWWPVLKFSRAIRHEGKFLCLLHYHRTSGLAQTRGESVNT